MFERMYSTRKLNSSLGLALALFCLCAVSCANMFQDKVAMSRNGTSSSLRDLLESGAKVGELDAPSWIDVSQHEYKDRIIVEWESVKNARYYTLKRAVVEKDANGEWKNQGESELIWEDIGTIYGTRFEDIIIKGDNDDPLVYDNKKYNYAYYYSVGAWNPMLGYKESEEKISPWGALLPPPEDVRASGGASTDYIRITWTGSVGASRYEVWRSTQNDGKGSTLVKDGLYPSETSYTDNNVAQFNNARLYYTVYSVTKDGQKSVASAVKMGFTKADGAPDDVTGVKVTQGHGDSKNSIAIEWNPSEQDGIFYNIFRSTSDSEYEELARAIPGTTNTYTDTKKFEENVYYYYYVQAYAEVTPKDGGDATILEGGMSVTGPIPDTDRDSFEKYAEGFILSAPPSVEVQKPDITQKSDPYTIYFAPAIGDPNFKEGLKGVEYSNRYEYIVLAGDSESGAFTELTRVSSNSLQLNDGKYSITPSNPQRKFYKMQTANSGELSAQTAAVSPAPYAPTDVYVTCAALVGADSNYVPTSTDSKTGSYNSETDSGSNSNGVHPVKIVWTAPEGDDAVYYNIYRKTSFTSNNWGTPINEEPVQGTSYIDKNENGRPDIVYYYSVVSLNSLKQGANRSTVYKPELIGSGADAIIKTFDVKIDGKDTRCGKGWGWGALSAWQYIQQMCKPIENSHYNCTPLKESNPLDMAKKVDVPGLYGYLHYDATDVGLGSAYANLEYFDYADYYINDDESLGYSFLLNGHTDTDADWSKNGIMKGTVTCKGMYPGSVSYNYIEVKAGASGGGYYELQREGIDTGTLKVYYMAGHDIKYTIREN